MIYLNVSELIFGKHSGVLCIIDKYINYILFESWCLG